jgi:hypothetical protein
MEAAKLMPTTGDYIAGRCVTMNTMHDGQVMENVGTHSLESTTRFRIRCEDGRERIVFYDRYAFRPDTHKPDARVNAAAWAAYDALGGERYYCNKCGSFPGSVHHNRPDGTECPYIARAAISKALGGEQQ